MSPRALAPSPIARRLFELAERRADGTLAIGERTVVLSRGAIVDVTAGAGDESLVEFMVRAGRIDAGLGEEATRRARARDLALGDALVAVGVKLPEVRSARRAVFLDRLVRALAAVEAEGTPPAPFAPDATFAGQVDGEELGPLVLDALERRAGEHDAGRVGERASEQVHFAPGPFAALARAYVQQTDATATPAVFELFRRSPASASRIAALVRAGLATLQPEHAAPPPTRPKSLAPPSASLAPRAPSATTSSDGPRYRDTLRPGSPTAREPIRRLEPGAAPLEPAAFPSAGPLPQLPEATGPLDDALDALERAVADVELAGADRRVRADAWLAFGRGWLDRCASVDEAARCAREAAAADPTHREALIASTRLCAAMGRVDLARAYARAAAHYASEPVARWEALLDLARLAERDGDLDAALASLDEASRLPGPTTEAFQRLVSLSYARADVERALASALGAAQSTLAQSPLRARAWAEAAQMLASNPDAASFEAAALAALGRPLAASAILAARARAPFDAATKQRLLVEAGELAEQAREPELAFARMLEAHTNDPTLEATHELLAASATTLGPRRAAPVLEHLAGLCSGDARVAYLAAAADAFEAADPGSEWAFDLRVRAMLGRPRDARLRAAVRAHAERRRRPSEYADALERVLGTSDAIPPDEAARLALDLAEFASSVLGDDALAHAVLVRHGGAGDAASARFAAGARSLRAAIDGATQRAAEASLVEGPSARAALARLLASSPEHRTRAIAEHRAWVAADPSHDDAARALERLLFVVGEDDELRLLASARADLAAEPREAARRFRRWCGLSTLFGELDDALSAVEAWLAKIPDDAEAAARLDGLARRSGALDLRRAGLGARYGAATNDTERATILCELSAVERARGDIEATVAAADAARALRPDLGDPAVLLLEELPRVEPASALAIVEHAREALGDSPQLLLVGADLCATLGDDVRRAAFVDARIAIGEDPATIAPLVLERALEQSDPALLRAAIEAALERAAVVPGTPGFVERALDALAPLDARAAAELSLLAADRLGESRFAELAMRHAEYAVDTTLQVAALERWVAWSSGGARCVHLRTLAALHREGGDRAAEARTWLRLLSEDAAASDALERLSVIYAEARDRDRLLAVLALRLEAATTKPARRERLLHLAAVTVKLLDDVERAEGFLRRIVAESDDPAAEVSLSGAALVAWARPERAVSWFEAFAAEAADGPAETLLVHAMHVALEIAGHASRACEVGEAALARLPGSTALLVEFERAALAERDVERVLRVYGKLEAAALGVHGERGITYRCARMLERLERPTDALDAYVRAFLHMPTDGVVFRALERLAVSLGRHDVVASSLRTLADAARGDERARHLGALAAVLEGPLADPVAALELAVARAVELGSLDAVDEARRLYRLVAARAPDAADRCIQPLEDALRARVEEGWDTDDRVRVLHVLARIAHDDRGRLAAALADVDAAVRLCVDQPDAEVAPRVELLCDAAEWLGARGDPRALTYLEAARTLAPEAARVAAVSRVLSTLRAPSIHPAADDAATREAARRAETESQLAAIPDEVLEARAADGDLDAIDALARRLEGDPTSTERRAALLVRLVRLDPSRSEAYGPLAEAARLLGDAALAGAASTVAALFDDTVAIPSTADDDGHAAFPFRDHLRDDVTGDVAVALEALSLALAPMQRRSIAFFGLTGGDRLGVLGQRPLAKAFVSQRDRFGVKDLVPYVRKDVRGGVRLIPTAPTGLLIDAGLEDDPEALSDHLARALAVHAPEFTFVTGFDRDARQGMIDAVRAAFGPPDASAQVPRDHAAVAAELWQVVGAAHQAALRTALVQHPGAFDVTRLVEAVESVAAHGALLTSSLPRCLSVLERTDPAAQTHGLGTRAGFSASVRASGPLRATLRAAFGRGYLDGRPDARGASAR